MRHDLCAPFRVVAYTHLILVVDQKRALFTGGLGPSGHDKFLLVVAWWIVVRRAGCTLEWHTDSRPHIPGCVMYVAVAVGGCHHKGLTMSRRAGCSSPR